MPVHNSHHVVYSACTLLFAAHLFALRTEHFTHIPGQKLVNQILANTTAGSAAQCCVGCIRHPDCRAVNYRAATDQCQLSGGTHVKFVTEVEVDEAWTMYLIPGPCDVSWVHYGTSCYWIEQTVTLNMTDSVQFCTSLGARLLELEDLQETQFLTVLAHNAGLWRFWIGLNDLALEQTYVWLSGAPVNYINFKAGEGDRELEDCVNITPLTTYWADINCEFERNIICEAPLG